MPVSELEGHLPLLESQFFEIRKLSARILKSTLSCRVGAILWDDQNSDFSVGDISPLEKKILQIYKHSQWLRRQIHDSKVALKSLQLDSTTPLASSLNTNNQYNNGDDDEEKEDHLQEEILLEQKKLLAQSNQLSLKTLIHNRLHLNSALLQELFPSSNSPNVVLRDHILYRDSLVATFLGENQQNFQLQQQIREKQNQISQIKEENRKLMEIIHSNKNRTPNSENSEMISRREKELSRQKSRFEIIRNVFQALILESGVDWSEDAELCATLLSLGESHQV